MYCVVPLAGPDFFHPSYGVKALCEVDGEPLIRKAIGSRAWFQSGELTTDNIFFVLRETDHTQSVSKILKDMFSGCQIVTIPHLTRGAVLSSLAAMALVSDFERPIVVDLVDILYESNIVVKNIFQDKIVGGFLPYFKSSNEKYSYLVLEDDKMIRTAEKQVISDNASAGTYFFRDLSVLLGAYQDSIKNSQDYAVRDNLFLCPVFNGVAKQGLEVKAIEVTGVCEISLKFHN